MDLWLYNSLTRKKELFVPLDPHHVKMYVCGPTVYDWAHLGNARPVVVFDTLYRLLRHLYPRVTYVRNITDVDDKINAAALKNGESIQALTERTLKVYHEDMEALGALPPDKEPRATEHIPAMIAMIETLIALGHAYVGEGHVLFEVETFPQYGTLSKRDTDEMLAGARVEVAPYKKHSGDFVLWKPSDDKTPGWESPWGYGRPGWHIECSAMSGIYLGPVFDIHGGGIDLIFPHHENERAQSCCAHKTDTFARYWLHNGHLTLRQEKMSKSLGNFFTVRELLKIYPGETLRLALLMTQYRQPIEWSETTLIQAQNTLDRFYAALKNASGFAEEASVHTQVVEALCEDMNTPLAIAALHELVSEINKTNDPSHHMRLAATLKKSATFLGILSHDPIHWFQQGPVSISEEEIEASIKRRNLARQEKDFKGADEIRQMLLEQGVVLEDSSKGTTWRRA